MIKVINGVKFYPVCSREHNEHKIEYWYNKAWLDCYDTYNEEAETKREEAEKMLNYFMCYCSNGIVYAPYKDGQRIKEMIVCYDLYH